MSEIIRLFKNSTSYLIIFLLYVSTDSLLFGTNGNNTYTFVLHSLYFCFALYSAASMAMHPGRYSKTFPYLFLFTIFILLTTLVNGDFSGGYILQIAVYISAIYIITNIPIRHFFETYETILFYIATLGLILFVLANTYSGFVSMFPTIENSAGYLFYNMWVLVCIDDASAIIMRNWGLFREPGMYAIYLLLALLINLFYYNKPNKRHCYVYIICIVTTFSTAGVILLLPLLGVYFSLHRNVKPIYLFVFFLCIIIAYQFTSNTQYYNKLFSKLSTNSASYGSTTSRLSSLTIPYTILSENIITGVGLNKFADRFEKHSLSMYNERIQSGGGSTNTFANQFAMYGVFSGLLYVFLLFKASRKINRLNQKSQLLSLLIFIILLAAFSNEDVRLSLFFNSLIFYGASNYS